MGPGRDAGIRPPARGPARSARAAAPVVVALVVLGMVGVLGASPAGAAPAPAVTSGIRAAPPVAVSGLARAPWAAKGKAAPVWGTSTPMSAVTATSPWALQTTPNPTVPSGTLTADACESSSCTAVGDTVDPAGTLVTWAESGSGASWTLQSTPNPTGASASELLGVACLSTSSCTAVGFSTSGTGVTTTLVETWNGAGWTIQPSPNPTGTTGSGLLAVACSSSSACQAVGESTGGAGGLSSLAEGWNGATWSIEATPPPTGSTGTRLLGVACTTAATCTAVGGYGGPGGVGLTMAEVWNGTSWSVQSTPNPAGSAGAGLLSVSCSSAGACTAVGDYDTASGALVALAEAWNGTSWSIQSTPKPTGAADTALNSVSCTLGTCTAAGFSAAAAAGALPLAEAWNGTSWTIQATPSPSGATAGGFLAVSCASTSSCVGVGSYDRGSNSIPVPLVEVWSAPTWSVETGAIPASAGISDLKGVSCVSGAACVAVGFAENDVGATLTLAEAWNGTSWSIESTPDPAGTTNAQLNAVSCSSPSACTAVGDYYQNSTGANLTLAETWNGRTWSIQNTPNPAGTTTSALFGVSCTSPSACTAVGEGASVPLAEAWNGTIWSVQATPTPAGSVSTIFFGVSCTSATSCTAVGMASSEGESQTLAERWNGAGWAIQATPDEPESANILSGVSCPTESACVAVGSYENDNGTLALAEAWNGAVWTVQATPDPAPAIAGPSLAAVSCTSASACAAVGTYSSTASLPVAFAEAWSGTTWSVQSVPSPAGSVSSLLNAVACTSGGCASVGYRQGSSGVAVTLAVENPGAVAIASDPVTPGYWLVNGAGVISAHGGAAFYGDTRSLTLAQPVRGISATSDGQGYLFFAADGGVFAFGDAKFSGSLPGLGVHVSDIVGIASTRDGKGYWMVGADGGLFAFGDARFVGSLPGLGVHVSDIVGIAAAPSGNGYLMVGSDGGVFAFGTAAYHGSLPGLGIAVTDIVAIAPSATESGYLLVGADGGTFSFGSGAPYEGSLPGIGVSVSDVVGLALTPDSSGYWMAEATGAVWNFGDAGAF